MKFDQAFRVCSVLEPGGMEWNHSVPRTHSCVRFRNGVEPEKGIFPQYAESTGPADSAGLGGTEQ